MTPLYIILVNFEQCKEASKELVYGNNEIEITEALVAWRGKAFQKNQRVTIHIIQLKKLMHE